MPIIPVLRRQRPEGQEGKASLGYMRPVSKKQTNKKQGSDLRVA